MGRYVNFIHLIYMKYTTKQTCESLITIGAHDFLENDI